MPRYIMAYPGGGHPSIAVPGFGIAEAKSIASACPLRAIGRSLDVSVPMQNGNAR